VGMTAVALGRRTAGRWGRDRQKGPRFDAATAAGQGGCGAEGEGEGAGAPSCPSVHSPPDQQR
jgi:hypothetical protein